MSVELNSPKMEQANYLGTFEFTCEDIAIIEGYRKQLINLSSPSVNIYKQ